MCQGPLLHELTLIPAWITIHMAGKVWNEILCPFSNFNGCTIEVWEWRSNFTLHFIMDVITYPWWNYTPRTTKLLGGILVSPRPSVRPSVRQYVRPSVRPAFRVRSVAPTVLVGSISYSYILSSNFRRCVACKVYCKISKFEFLATF